MLTGRRDLSGGHWQILAALFIGQDCIDVFIVPDKKHTHTLVTNIVFVDRGDIFAVFVDLLL